MMKRDECFEQLEKLLKGMKVSSEYSIRVKWLNKNLPKRNKDHPKFKETHNLIQYMVKRGFV